MIWEFSSQTTTLPH